VIGSAAAMRRIGWGVLLALCCAALFGLALQVNAVRSEVRRAEARIVALKRETMYLEIEYETRANQQQLAAWNAVDFGYAAPNGGQYLENVRELAALGQPAGPGAPEPIRVATAPTATATSIVPAMVSPLTGKAPEDEEPEAADLDHDKAAAGLGERLAKVAGTDGEEPAKTDRPSKADKTSRAGKSAKPDQTGKPTKAEARR
jgi:hypothetical protein